ncbi:MAG TPA: hypothetical protein VF181_05730 [Balneolaceae bacterium]
MKTLKLHIPDLTKIFFLIALSSLLTVGCGDNSTDSEPPPEPVPPPVSFDSGTLSTNESFSYTFEDEGSVEYFCELHAPDMQGVVNVRTDAEISGQDTVRMEGMQFVPSSITITPGTEIIWINDDGVDHTVTSGNPDSGDDGGGTGY